MRTANIYPWQSTFCVDFYDTMALMYHRSYTNEVALMHDIASWIIQGKEPLPDEPYSTDTIFESLW